MRVPRTDAGRRRSGWLAVTLGVAGALAGALVGAGPAAAAGTASLTLRPDHGRPTTPFVVQYSFSAEANVCPATVSFTWDDQPLGTARVTRAGQRLSSLCVASFSSAPPADVTGGRHTVGVDAVAGHPAKTETYTVQGGATPTRTPTPGFSDDPSLGAGDPAAGVTTPQGSVAPLANAGPAGPSVGASTPSGGGGSVMSLILLFGGLLVVGGIILFGLLVYWTRRGAGGGVEPEPVTPGAQPPYGMATTRVYGASQPPPADTATRVYPPQDPYGAQDPYPAEDPYPVQDSYGGQDPYPEQDHYSAQDPYGAKDPRQTAYDPYSFDHGDRQEPGPQHR